MARKPKADPYRTFIELVAKENDLDPDDLDPELRRYIEVAVNQTRSKSNSKTPAMSYTNLAGISENRRRFYVCREGDKQILSTDEEWLAVFDGTEVRMWSTQVLNQRTGLRVKVAGNWEPKITVRNAHSKGAIQRALPKRKSRNKEYKFIRFSDDLSEIGFEQEGPGLLGEPAALYAKAMDDEVTVFIGTIGRPFYPRKTKVMGFRDRWRCWMTTQFEL